jgi:hypothetical protein
MRTKTKGQKPPLTGPTVSCPSCRRKQAAKPGNDAMYRCTWCQACFDNDPNEGGDFEDENPAARLVREEQRRQKFGGKR